MLDLLRYWRALLALLLGVLLAAPAAQTIHAADERCFPETGQCISGPFRRYWEQNGGLAVFGYPISSPKNELNHESGQTFLAQWFERNRFELPPGLTVANLRSPDHDLMPAGESGSGLSTYVGAAWDPKITWDDLVWLADISGLPVIPKGILHPQDAILAFEHGDLDAVAERGLRLGRQQQHALGAVGAEDQHLRAHRPDLARREVHDPEHETADELLALIGLDLRRRAADSELAAEVHAQLPRGIARLREVLDLDDPPDADVDLLEVVEGDLRLGHGRSVPRRKER